MAVHEPGDRAQAAAVELDDVAVERREFGHPPDGLDRLTGAEDERVLEHVDLAERVPTERSVGPGGRRELRQVADKQPRRHASGARGIRSPPSSAAAIASG